MFKHTGSARDPFELEPSKSAQSTPGLGWVIVGFVAICIAVALAQTGTLQHSVALMASASGRG